MLLKIIFDAVLINVSFILAYFVRFKILFFITPDSIPIFEQYLSVLVFVTLIWLAIFKLIGLYDERKCTSLIDELASLFVGVAFGTLVLVGLLFLYREFWVSRLVIVNAWWIAFLLLTLMRIFLFTLKRGLQARGWGVKNTIIIGCGEIAQALALKISKNKSLGYRLNAFFTDSEGKQGQSFHGISVLGKIDQVKQFVRTRGVKEIIIADVELSVETVLDIITECERFGLEFKIVPGILELIATRIDVDELAGIPLITVTEIQLKGFNAAIKRLADISLSLVCIVIFLPVWLIFPILIKLTSKGPILFNQKRVGKDQQPFAMFKFRSMVKGADELVDQLQELSEAEGHLFKIKDDPRITPLGKFMRHWSVDELPQLFNVLLGTMSMVGPRPPLPREVANYKSWHKKRLRIRPGITGPWQVSGRSLLPFDDMVRLDIYYIENWSLWLDFKIMVRTIPVVLFGTGAY